MFGRKPQFSVDSHFASTVRDCGINSVQHQATAIVYSNVLANNYYNATTTSKIRDSIPCDIFCRKPSRATSLVIGQRNGLTSFKQLTVCGKHLVFNV